MADSDDMNAVFRRFHGQNLILHSFAFYSQTVRAERQAPTLLPSTTHRRGRREEVNILRPWCRGRTGSSGNGQVYRNRAYHASIESVEDGGTNGLQTEEGDWQKKRVLFVQAPDTIPARVLRE